MQMVSYISYRHVPKSLASCAFIKHDRGEVCATAFKKSLSFNASSFSFTFMMADECFT